jgi:RNA polymerase sigma-70 factor (ECF subfamily)
MQAEEGKMTNATFVQEYNFTEFYNEYFPRVYNYVYYRVNNYHDADDLTSLIFAKLFEKQSYYQWDKAPIFAWTFSIARNTVTDYYRRLSRSTYTPLEATFELMDLGQSPDDIAVSNEVRQNLHKALASLSERERNIIAMKFWSGFSNRQIAKFTGLSESNIGVTLFRAMRRLRHTMVIQGVDMEDGDY